MIRWSEVAEARRRRADELARVDGRYGWRPYRERRPHRLVLAYRRALAVLGTLLVSLGCRLQAGYLAWTASDESYFSPGLGSDGLIAKNHSAQCG